MGKSKGREESVAPDNMGVEMGDTPKGDDARVLIEVCNKSAWGS